MSYTLKHTAEEIDYKLDLLDKNKNLLPYPYDASLPEGLENVGDGSILTTGKIGDTNIEILLRDFPLPAGKKYIISLSITDILENTITNSNCKLIIKADNEEKTELAATTGYTEFDLSAESGEKAILVFLEVPANTEEGLLIKPQIEEVQLNENGEEILNKTTWVPYMGTVGNYVDERFNSTNTKIKAIAQQLNSGSLTDTNVVLDSDLKTYYNVGKIQNASGTNPVTIGNKGDTLRNVFDRLFNMDEVQPTITQNPSVSCTLSSDASDERGTSISSISYSITFNDGKYTNAETTGVKMTDYSFSAGTASSSTTTTGTITLPNTYIVGTSSAFSTSLTANHDDGDVAKTNLGNNSNPEIKIPAGAVSTTSSFSKTAKDYPYYISDSSATSSEVATKSFSKKTTSLASASGEASCSYNTGAYVWILTRKGTQTSQPNKKIQAYSDIAKEWGDFLGGTELMGEIQITKANNVLDTFYAYRTKNTAASGDTAKFRLN